MIEAAKGIPDLEPFNGEIDPMRDQGFPRGSQTPFLDNLDTQELSDVRRPSYSI